MEDLNTTGVAGEPDGLFYERLDAFCRAEIKAFAERERRSLEETRKYVAEWHSRFLFQPQDTLTSPQDRITRVKSVLTDASRILESLSETSGVHSFLLAVDPTDASSSGFLGGSVVGREFWRGQRGGGDAGAKAFKIHCLKSAAPVEPSSSTAATPKASTSRSLKTELYDGVRKALRSASGVRNAEMRWTNPALLSTYGVCLVGWPPTIPAQNPSSLKANQNKELLDALESGTMHFVRILATPNDPPPAETPPTVEEANFSWAIEYDAVVEGGGPHKRARTDNMLDLSCFQKSHSYSEGGLTTPMHQLKGSRRRPPLARMLPRSFHQSGQVRPVVLRFNQGCLAGISWEIHQRGGILRRF